MNTKTLAVTVAALVHALLGAEARYASVNFSVSLTVDEDAPQQLSQAMVRLCAAETHISMAALARVHRDDIAAGEHSAETKCFVHCLYERMGWLHDGIFVPLDLIGQLARATQSDQLARGGLSPGARQCYAQQRAENKCERAFELHRCLLEARKQPQGAQYLPPRRFDRKGAAEVPQLPQHMPPTVPLMDAAIDVEQ